MKIIEAYIINQQVNWIAGDSDVKSFGVELTENHAEDIDEEKLNELKEILGV